MVVGYYHVKAESFCVFSLFNGGNAAVNGNYKAGTAFVKDIEAGAFYAVTFLKTFGNVNIAAEAL